LGYSNGGHQALILAGQANPYNAFALLAPAFFTNTTDKLILGPFNKSVSRERLAIARSKGFTRWNGLAVAENVIKQFRDEGIAQSDKFIKKLYLRGMDDIPGEIADAFTVRHISWSRIIWDISTVGYLVNPNWCPSVLTFSPVLCDDMSWKHEDGRHPVRLCHYVSRDQIFGDMFAKLEKA
jgi:hypothetical protein